MISELVQVGVDGTNLKWFKSRGYDVPVREVQCWTTNNGNRVKNGKKMRVPRGTRIMVKPEDLLPGSNVDIEFVCDSCGTTFKTRWSAHRKKISNNCKVCQAKKSFNGGCHSYWVTKLITEKSGAYCDISGETDKRFLELHHLLSRSLGGVDAEENYVVISSNYHRAFHNWMGGSNVPSTVDDYQMFKRLELEGKKPKRKRDMLAEDWMVV